MGVEVTDLCADRVAHFLHWKNSWEQLRSPQPHIRNQKLSFLEHESKLVSEG